MTGYDKKKKEVGRRRATVAELRCDYCSLTYGTAPCTASVGVTGSQKCFNTRKTCQDPVNYAPQPKSYFFSDQPLLLPPQGQMVIVAGRGEEFAVSFDGAIYTVPPSPPSLLHFMSTSAINSFANNLTTSSTSFSGWIVATTPCNNNPLYAVNYANGRWFIGGTMGLGGGADGAVSADNGATWTGISPLTTATENVNNFTFAAGLYIATGNQGHYATSPDGLTWTQRTSPIAANCRWAETDGSILVLAGEQAPDNTHFNWSTDGINWTLGTVTGGRVTFGIRKVTYANGLFVAIGYRGGTNEGVIYTSPDGKTWTYRANPYNTLDGLVAAAFGNGIWVVTSANSSVMTSPDAITWTVRAGFSAYGRDIVFHNGFFFACSDDGKVYSSIDGITWDTGQDTNRGVRSITKLAVKP